MNLKIYRTLWGLEPDSDDVLGWSKLFREIKAEGYHGVEAIGLTYRQPHFREALRASSLSMIAQVHTAGGYLDSTGYVYNNSVEVNDHIESLKTQIDELLSLDLPLSLINVHSGHDSWCHSDSAIDYFERSTRLFDSTIQIVHETHRGRTLFTPYSFAHIVAACPELLFNADLSHWVNVLERIPTPSELQLDTLAPRAALIHARVGHPQGPQHPDPRGDEETVQSHVNWWRTIFRARKTAGAETMHVTMEHGPPPYQISPIDLAAINSFVRTTVLRAWNDEFDDKIEIVPSEYSPPTIRVVPKKELVAIATPEVALDSAAKAYRALSNGEVASPVPVQLSFPEKGDACIKPGHIHGSEFYCVKVASGFQTNSEVGIPNNSGVVMVFSAETGGPVAILADDGYLTDLRTAAAAILAAKTFTNSGPVKVGVIGSGVQARMQIELLSSQFGNISSIKIWSRRKPSAEKLIDHLRSKSIEASYAESPAKAVSGCDLVLTCTCSRKALICNRDVSPGATVIAVGSDSVGKREVDIFGACGNRVIVDTVENANKIGECQHATCDLTMVGFGDVLTGKAEGRSDPSQIILVDFSGCGAQDASIANAVMKAIS